MEGNMKFIHKKPKLSKGRKPVCFLLCLIFVLSLFPGSVLGADGMGDLTPEQPVLVITGQGIIDGGVYTADNVSNEKSYTLADLQALSGLTAENLYSAINSSDTRRIFRSEGVDLAGLLELSGYSGDSLSAVASDGYSGTIDLSSPRYYYPGVGTGDAAGETAVAPILAWGSARSTAPEVPRPEAMQDQNLQVFIGQENVTDVNNSLFVGNVGMLLAGDEITGQSIAILGTSYTRAQLLLMQRAEWSYTYITQGGDRTDLIRGVPLAVLLERLSDNALIEFQPADGWAGISAYSMTKGELIAKNAILAYEICEDQVWNGIFKTARSGPETGCFSLYIDGMQPASMIVSIRERAAFSDLDGFEWAAPAIEALAEAGIVQGIGNNRFDPGGNFTRSAFVTILGQAMEIDTSAPAESSRRFNDVDYDSWYGPFIGWGVMVGLLRGYGDGNFGPEDALTMEHLLIICDKVGFTDIPDTIDTEAVRPATRAEASVIVHAMLLAGIRIEAISTLTPYKHITYEGAPYNLDAITGATLTVEGPGVDMSVPITVRQLQETIDNNVYRGVYTDNRGQRSYEGIRLLSLIDGYINENVVTLDDNIEVVFKNRWRQDVGRMTYSQIMEAENSGNPVILAYGMANADESNTRPLVFIGGAGENPALGNDDGPLKLVYNMGMAGSLPDSGLFTSVAYLYVEEYGGRPGFKHITANDTAYNNPANTDYLITFTGEALGREVTLSLRDLQEMVEYGPDGRPAADGLGHRDEYSLSNTTYWYVNEYEGVKLWDLLVYMGLPASMSADNSTLVSFSSWDNYLINTRFSLAQLADPDQFYFYEKSPLDIGTDRPTREQLSTPEYQPGNQGDNWIPDSNGYPAMRGYPVLLAYGLNGYPYIKDSTLPGFRPGLGNDGGPMRLIYGKADGLNRTNPNALENYAYFYNNGSQQLQRVQEVYVGNELRYSTHMENPDPAYQAMKDRHALTVDIVIDGQVTSHSFTLSELEAIIYGVDKRTRDGDGRQEKGYYFTHLAGGGGDRIQDLYEGVNLEYLLLSHIGLQGTLGTVEFYSGSNAQPDAIHDLADIGSRGYNSLNGTDGLGMAVAFAKNGYPLVADRDSAGYVRDDPYLDGRAIMNNGGPLMFVRGQTAQERDSNTVESTSDNKTRVQNLTRIVVNLDADSFAHISPDQSAEAAQEILFSGSVAQAAGVSITVGTLETMQRYMTTGSYSVGGAPAIYRGLDLLRLLNDRAIGASGLMSYVTIRGAGGETEISLERLTAASAAGKPIILAYGFSSGGPPDYFGAAPLSPPIGPVRLIIDGATSADCITNVGEVAVSASTLDGWKHNTGVYAQYAGTTLEISGQNLAGNRNFTLAQLEAMDNIFVFDTYSIGSTNYWSQGVDLYKLLQNIGFAGGLTTSEITVTASDGYSIQFTGSQLADGVNGKPMILAFGQGTTQTNGLPLVPTSSDVGYSPVAANDGGPLRLMVHDNSGWSVKNIVRIVVGAAGGTNVEGNTASTSDLHEAPARIIPLSASPHRSESMILLSDSSAPIEREFNLYQGGENGFPEAGVRVAVPDKNGGFWVGTNGGGAVYTAPSGEMTVYTTPQLRNNSVTGIAVDSDGGVWLAQGGTSSNQSTHSGVAYFKDGEFTFFNRANSGLPSDWVYALDIASDGSVWFTSQYSSGDEGSFNGGITKYAPSTGEWFTWTIEDSLPTASGWDVKADNSGGAWLTTYRNSAVDTNPPDVCYVYINAAGEVVSFPDLAGIDEYSWPRSIAIDPDGGTYIVRSSAGTNRPDHGGYLDYIAPDGSVTSYAARDVIPDLVGKAVEMPPFYPTLRIVFADDSGDLWLGTDGLGVYRCTVSPDGAISVAERFSCENGYWPEYRSLENIWSILVSEDAIFIGSNGGMAWTGYETGSPVERPGAASREEAERVVRALAALPDADITRAVLVEILASLTTGFDIPDPGAAPFTDVPERASYAGFIVWAASLGLVNGYPDGSFRPEGLITREELAVLVDRFIRFFNLQPMGVTGAPNYIDQSRINSFAAGAVLRLHQYGIMGGIDGLFNPGGTVMRSELIEIINMYIRICLD